MGTSEKPSSLETGMDYTEVCTVSDEPLSVHIRVDMDYVISLEAWITLI